MPTGMTTQAMGSQLGRYKPFVSVRTWEAFTLGDRKINNTYCRVLFMLQPSEHNTYADIEAAYKCLEESYGAKQEDIILYGQSVGSGPTVDLAARLPRLRAVILHSPISSGLRVMYPVKRTYWFDIYKVSSSLSYISA